MGPQEFFARGFDRTVERFSQQKYCRVRREPDLFDGVLYTLDSWDALIQPLFERPWDFYVTGSPPPGGLSDAPALVKAGSRFTPYVFASPLPSGDAANDRVPFKWFRGPEPRNRTMLLFAPGWARPTQGIEEGLCSRIARSGTDVGLLTVPYHQARAPRGSYSGEYFISANVFWTVANFRQFVAEIKFLLAYMRERYDYVGLIGMSSGGFQANLATLGNEVDFLIGIMTGCRLGDITFESLLTRYVRRDLLARGIGREALARAWAISDMAVVGRASRARYVKQFITHYDPVMPLAGQEALWEIYGRPERRDLMTSHYGIWPWLNSVADDIGSFVRRCLPDQRRVVL